jgi:hypothetical protein
MGRRERQSEKKKQIIIRVTLALIMVLSAFGVMIGSFANNEMRYGKYKFELVDNQYMTKINGKPTFFYSLPTQVDYINLSSSVTNKIKEAYMVMLTFNPQDNASLQIIDLVRFDFSQLLDKVIVNGVLSSSEAYPDFPIITCANATLKTPVLIFNISDNTSIVDVDNCIYLNGRGTELVWLRDRLLYSYYGVIKDE